MSLRTLGPSCGGLCNHKSSGESRGGRGGWGESCSAPLLVEVMKLHAAWARHSPSRPKRVEALFKKPRPSVSGAPDLTDAWSRASMVDCLCGIEGTCFGSGACSCASIVAWLCDIDGTCFGSGAWSRASMVAWLCDKDGTCFAAGACGCPLIVSWE